MQSSNKQLEEELCALLLGERIPLDITMHNEFSQFFEKDCVLIPAGQKITKTLIRKLIEHKKNWEIAPSPIRNRLLQIFDKWAQFDYFVWRVSNEYQTKVEAREKLI